MPHYTPSIPVSATNSSYTYKQCAATCCHQKHSSENQLTSSAGFCGAFRSRNLSHRNAASSSWPWIMCEYISAVTRTEECPRRADTTGSGTPSANRCDVCVWRKEWRLAPFGSFNRRNSEDTAAETESGFKGEPSGLQKMRSPAW